MSSVDEEEIRDVPQADQRGAPAGAGGAVVNRSNLQALLKKCRRPSARRGNDLRQVGARLKQIIAEIDEMEAELLALRNSKFRSDLAVELDDVGDDNWKRNILARDFLDARCLISQLANLLYADMTAGVREAQLRLDGGEFVDRISRAADERVSRIDRHPFFRRHSFFGELRQLPEAYRR